MTLTEHSPRTDDAEPASAPLRRTGKTISAKGVVGAAVLGSIASSALAENHMPRRLPRGFSIDKPGSVADRGTAPNAAPSATTSAITAKDAARFLAQSTMGTKKSDITKLQELGNFPSWLSAQIAAPSSGLTSGWLFSKGFNAEKYRFDPGPFSQANWRAMITSNAQLRQRVAFALSNIFVINANSLNMGWPAFATANFFDILQLNAFGNFRILLEKVTLSSAMGAYLNMRGNYKADPSRRTEPDENYARELLQLFSIGLYELNQDGTPKLVNGNPVDTYKQEDISGLARALTGWDCDDAQPETHSRPMKHYPDRHELGTKTFLGLTIPAGTNGPESLRLALDYIFNHPNVAPFLAMGLIRRMVTSNPSSAYVGRVSAAFNNNGAGFRGDMKAVINAILTDPEARNAPTNGYGGKQREEILRFTAWARALQLQSPDNLWSFYIDLNQLPFRSPTVFNFFRPSFTPPQSQLATQGLVGPEFQLTNETSVFKYINLVQGLGYGSVGPCVANYSALARLAGNSKALLDEVNLLIAAGQVSDARIAEFAAAIDSIGTSDLNGQTSKVNAAVTLIMTAPEFIVVK